MSTLRLRNETVCFQHNGRSTRIDADSLREGIIKRAINRITRITVAGMVGLGIATSSITSGSILQGCSGEAEQKQEKKIENNVGATDKEGKASFDMGDGKFVLNAYDAETGKPVEGLLILFTAQGDQGAYLIIDPQNRYAPRIVGAFQNEPSEPTDGVIKGAVMAWINTNVVMAKKTMGCIGFDFWGLYT